MTRWTEKLVPVLFESSFMTLATADGSGVPWASPVEFVCDEGLRFYWTSMIDARHSRNVRENSWAAFSIYDSTQTPGVNAAVQGLYGEGPVEELSLAEVGAIRPAVARWISWRDADRVTPRPGSKDRFDDPDSPWRFYRLDPAGLYALDPVALAEERVVDSRVPVDLTESFAVAYRSRSD